MLGKYFVPTNDDKYAGVDTSTTTGEGQDGLQGAFKNAVREFVGKLEKDNGITVNLGYSGRVKKETAQNWANNGNDKYLKYNQKYG